MRWFCTIGLFAVLGATLCVPSFAGRDNAQVLAAAYARKDENTLAKSYEQLGVLLKGVNSDAHLAVYRGWPYLPGEGGGRYEVERKRLLKQGQVVESYGQSFYTEALSVSRVDGLKLRSRLKDGKTIAAFRGFKRCGRFHADYALVWTHGETVTEFHICFGCSEIRGFTKGAAMHADLRGDGYKSLKELLQGLTNAGDSDETEVVSAESNPGPEE